MDCSMPGFPVLYHLLELAQIHVHWVGDAIQLSHLLSSPSPPVFNLLAVQGTLKSLLQHHSSKESIHWCSAFFMVPSSHPYMTAGKTTALTVQTFFTNVISLLFNMLSRFVRAFLPRSKCVLISWLQSPSAVVLEPPKISLSLFPLFPHLFAMKWWVQMPWS